MGYTVTRKEARKSMKKYLDLLRVKHYLKNILVFTPIFFNKTLFTERFTTALIGFFSLCLISSTVYILNDIQDAPKDRLHPTKRFRPIADGSINILQARVIGGFCLSLSLTLSYLAGGVSGLLLLFIYFVLNVSYSFGSRTSP